MLMQLFLVGKKILNLLYCRIFDFYFYDITCKQTNIINVHLVFVIFVPPSMTSPWNNVVKL